MWDFGSSRNAWIWTYMHPSEATRKLRNKKSSDSDFANRVRALLMSSSAVGVFEF